MILRKEWDTHFVDTKGTYMSEPLGMALNSIQKEWHIFSIIDQSWGTTVVKWRWRWFWQ